MRKALRKLFILCVVGLLVAGCSSKLPFNEGMVQRLNNRGPIALSATNPYLAANLLLSKEMERSPELSGFVKHRGAPTALEVRKSFWAPAELLLFYPKEREFFQLESNDNSWIIRGPHPMASELLSQVLSITRIVKGAPALKLPENDEPLPEPFAPFPNAENANQALMESETEDPFIARLNDYEEKEQHQETSLSFNSEGFRSPSVQPPQQKRFHSSQAPSAALSPEERLQRAISLSPDINAELNPRGDLVHYVTSPQETLELISYWYTRDKNNTDRVARINKLSRKSQLSPGDSLVIPSYLLRNTKVLTEEAARLLSNSQN